MDTKTNETVKNNSKKKAKVANGYTLESIAHFRDKATADMFNRDICRFKSDSED